jgi:hypothetical protein
MPKIEIEVMYTRTITQEGSKLLELNIPQRVIDGGDDEIASWLDEKIEAGKIDLHKDIFKDSDINDEDEEITIEQVCAVED